jgi:hypothetical protein
MFGLPYSTTFVAFGLPVLIALLLILWGIKFSRLETDDTGTGEDSK